MSRIIQMALAGAIIASIVYGSHRANRPHTRNDRES